MSSHHPSPKHTYYPALDGLRALCVLIVFLFHHGLLAAGWVGVEVFFALSGFLITGILRGAAGKPSYWSGFYAKRVTRILPPVVLLLVIVALQKGSLTYSYLAYLLFAGNLIELTSHAIWQLSPLWSLAIEEHFYLIWPSAIQRLSRHSLIRLLLALIVAEPFVRALVTVAITHAYGAQHQWNNPIFLLTPFRLDALLAGALLALWLEGQNEVSALKRWSLPGTVSLFALFLGLEAVFPGFRRTADSIAFNSLAYSVTAIASALLIAHLVLTPEGWLAKLLSRKPIVYLGTISYGMYLFQLPVKAAVAALLPHARPTTYLLMDTVATVAFASASFWWFERRMIAAGRKLARRLGERSILPDGPTAHAAITG
jgi:peptidoglycan/LPS O-acetylase OafA/YrhL